MVDSRRRSSSAYTIGARTLFRDPFAQNKDGPGTVPFLILFSLPLRFDHRLCDVSRSCNTTCLDENKLGAAKATIRPIIVVMFSLSVMHHACTVVLGPASYSVPGAVGKVNAGYTMGVRTPTRTDTSTPAPKYDVRRRPFSSIPGGKRCPCLLLNGWTCLRHT